MWEQIRSNRRRSVFLIAALVVLPLLVGWCLGWMVAPEGDKVGLGLAALLLIVMLPIGWFGGKSLVLSSAGARPITHDDAPRLFNVVQEMTLAAGLPKPPRVYLLDCDAPNAFAMGAPDDGVVAVTTGLLMRLSRDELQGVIAHEVAHIVNEDAEYMTLAATLVGITVTLSELVRTRAEFSSGRRRAPRLEHRRDAALVALAALVVVLAPFMARMLYLACSRRREYLADACAARYTRYPAGLASALEKIAAQAGEMQGVGQDVAALCTVNPLRDEGASFFSTHPATAERVRILRAMAGGAGLADYERAFRSVAGGGVIGPRSLREATETPIRAASAEPDPPEIERARETVDILHRADGALFVDCPCGVRIKKPTGAAGMTIECPRCGRANRLPLARPPEDGHAPAFVFQPGRWQSFQCSCGGVVQLSPSFAGTQVPCPRCGAITEVLREESA